jgi:PHD/YefM family antitoxin component YafN of YafNO toxin-antitoxin module
MPKLKEPYVVDDQGNRISVVLDVADYQELLEELEELEAIRAYDTAKASGDQPIPFKQAVAEIETERE